MQFSLRTFLFISIVVGFTTCWYVAKRRGEIGIDLTVNIPGNQAFSFQSKRPETIREFTNYRMVREHDLQFRYDPHRARQNRLNKLAKDLTKFLPHYEIDQELLQTEKRALRSIANSNLNLQASFEHSLAAAWILDHFGDSEAFDWIVARFNNHHPNDAAQQTLIFSRFDRTRLIKKSDVLNWLKTQVKQGGANGQAARLVFFSTGYDRKPLVDWHIERVTSGSDNNYAQSLRWLVKHHPTSETLTLLAHEFDKGNRNNQHLVRTFLIQDFDRHPDLKEQADNIEIRIGKNLEQDLSNPSDSTMQVWYALASRGSELSKPLYVRMLGEQAKFKGPAARAMMRLGHNEELTRILLSQAQNKPPAKETKSLSNKPPAPKEKYGDLLEFDYLADIFRATGNQDVINLIRDKVYCDGKGWYHTDALLMLEKIGDPKVGDLWKSVNSADLASPQLSFQHNWYLKGHTRTKLLAWINGNLQTASDQLNIESVLSMPRYHPNEYNWQGGIKDTPYHYQFALFALAASGLGGFCDGENYELHTYNFLLEEMVPEYDDDFRITSHSRTESNEYTLRIVINNRLYQFTRPPNNPDWDYSYDVRAAAELLNVLAKRFGNQKTFLCIPNRHGTRFSVGDVY